MRIRLVRDVPVHPKHGLTQGREFEVVSMNTKGERGSFKLFVRGDEGVEVGVYMKECEVLSGNFTEVPERRV